MGLVVAAVAYDAVIAGAIDETLAGDERLLRIIIEGRDHDAFEDEAYAHHRMRVIVGIGTRRIGNKEQTHFPNLASPPAGSFATIHA